MYCRAAAHEQGGAGCKPDAAGLLLQPAGGRADGGLGPGQAAPPVHPLLLPSSSHHSLGSAHHRQCGTLAFLVAQRDPLLPCCMASHCASSAVSARHRILRSHVDNTARERSLQVHLPQRHKQRSMLYSGWLALCMLLFVSSLHSTLTWHSPPDEFLLPGWFAKEKP